MKVSEYLIRPSVKNNQSRFENIEHIVDVSRGYIIELSPYE